MKRILASLVVIAFAVAVQANDAKTCATKDKEKTSCCAEKVKTSEQAKDTCPFAKASSCKASSCKAAPVKQIALLSPKASDNQR